jgi:DNA-binding response OmpR family regulator
VAGTAIGPAIADQGDGFRHILIVDDELQIRELLSAYLQKQGYRVSAASTSEEAMEALRQTPVDLAVLDIGLANEDGLKLLSQIKIGYPGVRVVMLTGLGFVEDLLEEAQRKGADGYMSKVLSLDELHMAIQRALRPQPQPASAA